MDPTTAATAVAAAAGACVLVLAACTCPGGAFDSGGSARGAREKNKKQRKAKGKPAKGKPSKDTAPTDKASKDKAKGKEKTGAYSKIKKKSDGSPDKKVVDAKKCTDQISTPALAPKTYDRGIILSGRSGPPAPSAGVPTQAPATTTKRAEANTMAAARLAIELRSPERVGIVRSPSLPPESFTHSAQSVFASVAPEPETEPEPEPEIAGPPEGSGTASPGSDGVDWEEEVEEQKEGEGEEVSGVAVQLPTGLAAKLDELDLATEGLTPRDVTSLALEQAALGEVRRSGENARATGVLRGSDPQAGGPRVLFVPS